MLWFNYFLCSFFRPTVCVVLLCFVRNFLNLYDVHARTQCPTAGRRHAAAAVMMFYDCWLSNLCFCSHPSIPHTDGCWAGAVDMHRLPRSPLHSPSPLLWENFLVFHILFATTRTTMLDPPLSPPQYDPAHGSENWALLITGGWLLMLLCVCVCVFLCAKLVKRMATYNTQTRGPGCMLFLC